MSDEQRTQPTSQHGLQSDRRGGLWPGRASLCPLKHRDRGHGDFRLWDTLSLSLNLSLRTKLLGEGTANLNFKVCALKGYLHTANALGCDLGGFYTYKMCLISKTKGAYKLRRNWYFSLVIKRIDIKPQ